MHRSNEGLFAPLFTGKFEHLTNSGEFGDSLEIAESLQSRMSSPNFSRLKEQSVTFAKFKEINYESFDAQAGGSVTSEISLFGTINGPINRLRKTLRDKG